MNDRELLEAAAKAAGLEFARWDDLRECMNHPFRSDVQDSHWWNPLTDDGDALRLAVMLRMLIDCEDAPEMADRNAAVRRAIVLAAASMTPNV